MKILWHSVPSCYKTGYGTQTRAWTRLLAQEGHDVVISSIVGGMPSYINEDGIQTLGNGPRGSMGNDFIQAHNDYIKPDVIISLSDTFVYDMNKFKNLPWVGWHIVDSAPLIPQIAKTAKVCKHPLSLCQFGHDVLKDAGFASTIVPHGVDMENEFFPVDMFDARRKFSEWFDEDISTRLLVVMNIANMSRPSRKNFSAALKAFAVVKQEVKDALLYIHTEATGVMCGGENIYDMVRVHGLTPADVVFPNQYKYNMGMYGNDYLRTIYAAADCLLMTSLGEGFGLPIIEAYACGCRVIAPDFSSMHDIVIPEDRVADGMYWSNVSASNQFMVDYNAVALRILGCRKSMKTIPDYRNWGMQWNLADVHARYFKPFLQRIESGEINLRPEQSKTILGYQPKLGALRSFTENTTNQETTKDETAR